MAGLVPIPSWRAKFVMAGLVPAIHVFDAQKNKTWMPGTKPGMT
jgi:hypothetical protein